MIDLPIIGGILLIVGAILISEKGDMYLGSIMYILADICWIFIAYQNEGFKLGTFLVMVGAIFGVRTFYKLHYNKFHRNLNRNTKE
jgi:hypothetical protein